MHPAPHEIDRMLREEKQNREGYWREYDQEHSRCPNCGAKKFLQYMTATHGYDHNRGGCDVCHWEGIRHQLLPEPLCNEEWTTASAVRRAMGILYKDWAAEQ